MSRQIQDAESGLAGLALRWRAETARDTDVI
jgi:hypothetical protein